MTTILRGESVSKHFGGLKAVDEVAFELAEGEILGLIGPNGAGKTTLFSVIAGSIPPTSGRLVFADKEIAGWAPHRVVHAGICRTHQIVRPFGNLSVRENVEVGAQYGRTGRRGGKENPRAVVGDLLEFVELDDRAERMPAELTLAGRKRVELARALATHPRVLLLDEVIAGLNPVEAQRLVGLIRRIRERGTSIIMIEHVMHAVMGVSDRVMVLDHGQLIAEGAPAEVANDPQVIEAYLGAEATSEETDTRDAQPGAVRVAPEEGGQQGA